MVGMRALTLISVRVLAERDESGPDRSRDLNWIRPRVNWLTRVGLESGMCESGMVRDMCLAWHHVDVNARY